MRVLSVDSYLADINVAVDELGSPVDLIGLCQGGWMALVYAARFPQKVRRLVLVGAPIDVCAGRSELSRHTTEIPFEFYEQLVRIGNGRVLGNRTLELWGHALAASEADRVLQVEPMLTGTELSAIEKRFQEWYRWTVDLPGSYYLQIVSWLFKENRIAEGRFVALGHIINIADVRAPLFLLAARDDEVVAPSQLLPAASLVGTPKTAVEIETEPCTHLSLFLGKNVLEGAWQRIAQWLQQDLPDGALEGSKPLES